jgi:Flp pilus assembly protein TadG
MQRFSHSERGSTAVLTALLLPVLLGFIGLAADAVMWEISKRNMQGAADQAAIAAVVAYQAGAGADPATNARAVAKQFGFNHGSDNTTVTVSLVTPPALGYLVDYSVTITKKQRQYFTSLFVSAPTASATAEAATSSNGPCILVLSSAANGAFTNSGGSQVTLTSCDLDVNSVSATSTVVSGGGSKVSAQNINLVGGSSVSGGATLTASVQLSKNTGQALSDPYQYRTAPTVGSCATNGTSYNLNYNGGTGQPTSLNPGTYCGSITIGGTKPFTLNPGVYVITDTNGYGFGSAGAFKVSGGTLCAGGGVTIYVKSTKNAQISFSGGSKVYIVAPDPATATGLNGETDGIALWMDKDNPTGATVSFSGGSTQIIGGAIYAKHSNVTYSGGSATSVSSVCPNVTTACAGTTQIVSDTLTISGTSVFTHSATSNSCVADPASAARVKLIK